MSQLITVDRATLEQMVLALEKSVGAMQGLYGGWRCTQELKMANLAITAGRAALANAEPAGGDCTHNHLCNGRMVHLPLGEQCDKCGGSVQ